MSVAHMAELSKRPRSAQRLDAALGQAQPDTAAETGAGGAVLGVGSVESESALVEWLSLHGVNTSEWGDGTAKPVRSLLKEVQQGETRLRPSVPAVRMVRVVSVLVRHPTTGRILVEQHQQLMDGRIRIRNQLLAEKLIKDEDPRAGAVRALKEELGERMKGTKGVTVPAETTFPVGVETEVSRSYPTLVSEYSMYHYTVDVPGLPDTDFHTTEFTTKEDGSNVAKQRHFWTWRTMEVVKTMLEERRRSARLALETGSKRLRRDVVGESNDAKEVSAEETTLSVGTFLFDEALGALGGASITVAALTKCLFRWRYNASDQAVVLGMAGSFSLIDTDEGPAIPPADVDSVRKAVLERRVETEVGALTPEEQDLLNRLFPPQAACRLRVRALHGGFSGSKVLAVNPFNVSGGCGLPVVIKMDATDDAMQEKSNADDMAVRLGGNACRCVDWCVGETRAALVFELAGACWLLPGMMDYTFVTGGIETWKDLFVNTVVAGSGAGTKRLLRHPRSVLEEVFGEIMCRSVFSSVEVERGNVFELFGVSRAATKTEKKGLVDTAAQVAARARGVADGAREEEMRLAMVHGDLNGSNILLDSAGMSWIIDFAKSGRAHVLVDLVKLESFILFECGGPLGKAKEAFVGALVESTTQLQLPSEPPSSVLAQIDTDQPLGREWVELAWTCIQCLRIHALKYSNNRASPFEYYVGLLTLSLKCSSYADATMDRSLAIFTAGLLCDRIESIRTGGGAVVTPAADGIDIPGPDREDSAGGSDGTLEGQLQRYLMSERAAHTYITDPITREALNIEDHIVPLSVMQGSDVEEVSRLRNIDQHVEARLVAARRNRVRGARHEKDAPNRAVEGSMEEFVRVALGAEPAVGRNRVMLLGAAASGKSCMLKRALLMAARTRADGQGLVPILIAIIDLARFLAAHPDVTAGDDLLRIYLRHKYGAQTARCRMLEDHLSAGDILLLLDGLDEGGDQKDVIEGYIDRLCAETKLAIIISSRVTGFNSSVAAGQGMMYMQVCPLSSKTQMEIIDRRLAGHPREAAFVKEQISTELSYLEMSENPLMLSMLINILSQSALQADGALSKTKLRQDQLYDIAVTAMLHHAARGKYVLKMRRDPRMAKDLDILKKAETSTMLETLAYNVHTARKRDISSDDVIAAMTTCIAEASDPKAAEEVYLEVCNALNRGIRTSLVALFVGLSEHHGDSAAGATWNQMFCFSHLTFQEYFTARRIVSLLKRSYGEGDAEALEKCCLALLWGEASSPVLHQPWMKKVVSFCGSMLSQTNLIGSVVKALLGKDDVSAANACVLNQWVTDNVMPAEVGTLVVRGLESWRSPAIVTSSLLCPSPEIRRMALTEAKEFRFDPTSVADQMLSKVNELAGGDGPMSWITRLCALLSLAGLQCTDESIMKFVIDQLREAPISMTLPADLRTISIRTLVEVDAASDPVARRHLVQTLVPLLTVRDTEKEACRLCEMLNLVDPRIVSVLHRSRSLEAAQAMCTCAGDSSLLADLLRDQKGGDWICDILKCIERGARGQDFRCPALTALCKMVVDNETASADRIHILATILRTIGTPPDVSRCIMDLCEAVGIKNADDLLSKLPTPWNELVEIPRAIQASKDADREKAQAQMQACIANINRQALQIAANKEEARIAAIEAKTAKKSDGEQPQTPAVDQKSGGQGVSSIKPAVDELPGKDVSKKSSIAKANKPNSDDTAVHSVPPAEGKPVGRKSADAGSIVAAQSSDNALTTQGIVRSTIEANAPIPRDPANFRNYARDVVTGKIPWSDCTDLLHNSNNCASYLMRELFSVSLELSIGDDQPPLSWLGVDCSEEEGDCPDVITRQDIGAHYALSIWRERCAADPEWSPSDSVRSMVASRASAQSYLHIMLAKELRMGRDEVKFADVTDGSVVVPELQAAMNVRPQDCVRKMNADEIREVLHHLGPWLSQACKGQVQPVVCGGVLRDIWSFMEEYNDIDIRVNHRVPPLPRKINDSIRATLLHRHNLYTSGVRVSKYAVELTRPVGEPGPIIVDIIDSPQVSRLPKSAQGGSKALDYDVNGMELVIAAGRDAVDEPPLRICSTAGPLSLADITQHCEQRTFHAGSHLPCRDMTITVADSLRLAVRWNKLVTRGWKPGILTSDKCPHNGLPSENVGCRYEIVRYWRNGAAENSIELAEILGVIMEANRKRLLYEHAAQAPATATGDVVEKCEALLKEAKKELLSLLRRCARQSGTDESVWKVGPEWTSEEKQDHLNGLLDNNDVPIAKTWSEMFGIDLDALKDRLGINFDDLGEDDEEDFDMGRDLFFGGEGSDSSGMLGIFA